MSRLWRYRVRGGSRQGGFNVEDGLGEPVALVAKGLVVPIWELEGARGCGFRGLQVRAAGAIVAVQPAVRPYLDDCLFELGKEALLLQGAETSVVRGAGGEGAEGGLSRGAGVDGGFGSDEIVRV